MRVSYRSVPGPVVTFEQAGPAKWCCADMARRWGALVAFGVRGQQRTTNREVNLQTPLPQANGKVLAGVTAIQFCPWCGEAVEVCRVK